MVSRVDAAVDGVLLIAKSFEFLHVEDLLLFESLQFIAKSTLFVFENLQLELVDFFLLVNIDIIIRNAISIYIIQAAAVFCEAGVVWYGGAFESVNLPIASSAIPELLLLRDRAVLSALLVALFQSLDLFLFLLDFSKSLIYFSECLAFFPELPDPCSLPLSRKTAQSERLLIQPDPLLPPIAELKLYQVLVKRLAISLLLIYAPFDDHLLLWYFHLVHFEDLLLLFELSVFLRQHGPELRDFLLH